MSKIRFMYIQGTLPDHMLTLAYQQRDSGVAEFVDIGWAINKMVDPKTLCLDQRLRKVMGQKEFNELQKKFTKVYKGDQFNKKIARAIATGRLISSSCIFRERAFGTSLLEDVLTGVMDSQGLLSLEDFMPFLNEALDREHARTKESYTSSIKSI